MSAIEPDFSELFEKKTQAIMANIIEGQDGIIQRHNEIFSLTGQEVERKWGKPLKHLIVVSGASHAIGKRNQERWSQDGNEDDTKKRFAMMMLHGRSCQTTLEIIKLLEAGLPDGAQARARTLHELNVISTLLKENDPNLSEKYLDYANINAFKAMRELREVTKNVAVKDEVFNNQKQKVRELKAKYGERFCKENGWALDIIPGTGKISFVDLEMKAEGCRDYRPFYRSVSLKVHAGSSGDLGRSDTYDNGIPIGGPSVDGFGIPGSAAAVYIASITSNFVAAAKTKELMNAAAALLDLSEMTYKEFLEIKP